MTALHRGRDPPPAPVVCLVVSRDEKACLMTWVRLGDGSSHHPIVMAPLEFDEFDDRLINELFGFALRCASAAGRHMTDYVVTTGTARDIAGITRFDVIMPLAIRAGYFTEVILEDGRTAYKLVDDDPEFIHLRLKAEVDFERQRRSDNSNPALIIPVRLRDGDACRWCGVIVDWTSRTAGRSGTYDHLIPGQPAEIETYVVCCRSCNSSRKDGEHPNGVTDLQPAPMIPYFSKYTVKWLTDHPWVQQQGIAIPAATRKQVHPGHRVDGTQPPARDDSTPTPTQTRAAAPAAPSAPATGTESTSTAPNGDTDACDVPDASSAPRTLPDDASGTADLSGQPTAADTATSTNGVSAEIRGNPQTPTGGQGTDSVSPGRDGSGRDGSGQDGRTAPSGAGRDDPPRTDAAVPRSRRRGGRRRNPPPPTISPEPGM